ncbi:4a-hydroxytetrahydrobiopterin dehydratase [Candidatus Roizmanbacteria bacterium]|nr:4a-hydroxytetrahydrobiopterin dehydratase [Candidatus Roizmanbacteria bacterium]
MQSRHLIGKKCVPCEPGTPPLAKEKISEFQKELKGRWELIEGKKIKHKFSCQSFKEAIIFVNKVAALAEQENHHPNIFIAYKNVTITLSTHAIGGLSENDFILAGKIDRL